MSDTIQPALTPDEWASREIRLDSDTYIRVQAHPMGVVRAVTRYRRSSAIPVGPLPGVIALSNDALPDGHPNKLTRADVALLRDIAPEFAFRGIGVDKEIETLASKLEALLPPE
jgi:hypothetical protein